MTPRELKVGDRVTHGSFKGRVTHVFKSGVYVAWLGFGGEDRIQFSSPLWALLTLEER